MGRTPRHAGLAAAGLLLALALAEPPSVSAEPRPGAAAQRAPRRRPGRPRPGHGGQAPPPAPPPASTPAPRELKAPALAVERFTLDNGLRVVLAPVRPSPSVAVAVVYDAGARHEERGAAGLSSLVRHSMGLGSANLLRGEHERHVAARGGRTRGEVTSERAAYLDLLPTAELPLGLWLEADRLKSLQITPEGALAQREVLLGELTRRAGDPREAGRARLRGLVFQALWPYEHDPHGSASDVASLKPEAAQAFYEAFYAAGNAVLVVAGDIETEATSQLVRRFFETARRQERPPAFVAPPLPEQTSQRAAVVPAPSLSAPSVFYGWATPAGRTDDALAVEAALFVLGRLRLPQRLSHERALATRVEVSLDDQRVASLARLELDLVDDGARAEAQRLVEAELDSLIQKGPSEAELARFRAHAEGLAWRRALDPEQLALRLGDYELLHGDARQLADELPHAAALGRDQVRAAAARYLTVARRSLIELLPPGSPQAPHATPAPPAPPHAGPPGRPPHPPRPARPPRPKRR